MHDKFNEDRVESTTLPLNFRPYDSTRIPNSLEKQKSTKRPSFNASPTERVGFISTTTVIDQDTTTQTPFVCGLGSRDIRCRRPQNFETTHTPETTTTATFRETTTLRDTTTYPNYIQSNTIKPVVDTFCDRYPNSKRCTQRITEDLGPNVEILTFRPPSPFATVKYQTTTDVPTTFLPTTTFTSYMPANCARDPNDYRCQQNELIQTTAASQVDEKPLNCRGNNLDPRCPNPTPTNTPPTYLPPSTTQKLNAPRNEVSTPPTIAITRRTTRVTTRQPFSQQPITRQPITRQPVTKQSITKKPTKKFFICVPGSNDVNCDFEAKKEDQDSQTKEQSPENKIPAIPSRNQYTTKKPIEKPICYVGSTNPECQKLTTNIVTSRPTISTAKPPQAFTSRTSLPRFTEFTTKKPVFKPLSTTNRYVASEIPVFVVQEQPNCYPNSPDPACSFGPSTKKPVPKVTPTRTTTRTTTRATTRLSSPTTPKTIYKVPSTSQESTTEVQSTTTFAPSSPIKSYVPTTTETGAEITTTFKYIPEITTYKTTNQFTKVPASRCTAGSPDPQCKPNTKKPIFTPYKTESPTTTKAPVFTTTTRATTTTKQTTVTPKFSIVTNAQPTRPPVCYPGALDPRCQYSTTTKRPTIEPKLSVSTTRRQSFTTTTQRTPSSILISKLATTTSIPKLSPTCYPG